MNIPVRLQNIIVTCGLAALLGLAQLGSAITVTPTDDATLLANNILSGTGLTLISASFIGESGLDSFGDFNSQAGTFEDGAMPFGASTGIDIDKGILLSTGWAGDVDDFPPNYNAADDPDPLAIDDLSKHHGSAGDDDLTVLAGGVAGIDDLTADAVALSIDFNTSGGVLVFEYIFASEEYNEYVDLGFNDVFGLFVDGQNIALLPNLTTVGVTNVNKSDNPSFFRENTIDINSLDPAPFNFEFDGLTTLLTAEAVLSAGTHTLEIKIGDYKESDGIYGVDSAVLIKAKSVAVVPLPAAMWTGISMLGGLGIVGFVRRKAAA